MRFDLRSNRAIVLFLVILSLANPGYAQNSPNDAYELKKQIESVSNNLLILRQRKEAFQEIYQELNEMELIYNGIQYQDSTKLFNDLFDILETIEARAATTDLTREVRKLYQSLNKINRANKDSYRQLLVKFADLWKYQNAEATTAQKFIDSELQKFRIQTQETIKVNYDSKAVQLPEGQTLLSLVIDPAFTTSDTQSYSTIRALLEGGLLDQLRIRASEQDFNILSDIYENAFSNFRDGLKSDEQQLDQDIKIANDTYTEYSDKQSKVDTTILKFLTTFMVFIIALFLLPKVYKSDSVTRIYMAKNDTIFRLVCVFSLIVMIFLLGLSGILESQSIATLLGAISAYVLKEGIGALKDNGTPTPPPDSVPGPQSAPDPTPAPAPTSNPPTQG